MDGKSICQFEKRVKKPQKLIQLQHLENKKNAYVY